MRDLYKISLLLCTIFLILDSVPAQVSGYKGKRLILKTDLASPILERGYNLELESLIFRDLSISLDYSQRSKFDHVDRYNEIDTASFKGNTVGLKIRSYLNKAIPGPIGVYSCLLIRYGSVDIEGRFGLDSQFGQGVENFDDQRFVQVGIGWGYQALYKEKLSLDIGWTLVYSHFDLYSQVPYYFINAYGDNVTFLSNSFSSIETHMGVSIRASVGFLL